MRMRSASFSDRRGEEQEVGPAGDADRRVEPTPQAAREGGDLVVRGLAEARGREQLVDVVGTRPAGVPYGT
jgi:hypothetical protein